MKKLVLLFGAATMLLASNCKKTPDQPKDDNPIVVPPDEYAALTPTQQQESFVTDITATWCGPCGANGIPFFNELVSSKAGLVNGLSVHTDVNQGPYFDKLANQDAVALRNMLAPTTRYIPTFTEGTTMYGYDENNPQNNYYDGLTNATNNRVAKNDAMAAVALSQTIEGKTLTVKTKSKFFTAGAGTYTIALYVVEDDVIERQNVNGKGYVASFKHMHLLRGAITPSVSGETLATGDVAANHEVKKTYTYTLDDKINPANAYVVAVIYQMNGSRVVNVVNSNSSK